MCLKGGGGADERRAGQKTGLVPSKLTESHGNPVGYKIRYAHQNDYTIVHLSARHSSNHSKRCDNPIETAEDKTLDVFAICVCVFLLQTARLWAYQMGLGATRFKRCDRNLPR
jgi:hypothetical protein